MTYVHGFLHLGGLTVLSLPHGVVIELEPQKHVTFFDSGQG